MKKDFKVIICGSREFSNYDLLKYKCDNILKRKFDNPNITVTIISGGARGADKLGERYAKEKGLPLEIYPANWDKYGKKAGYLRNKQMAEVSNACIAFKLKSKDKNVGTNMMISISKSMNLLIREITEI